MRFFQCLLSCLLIIHFFRDCVLIKTIYRDIANRSCNCNSKLKLNSKTNLFRLYFCKTIFLKQVLESLNIYCMKIFTFDDFFVSEYPYYLFANFFEIKIWPNFLLKKQSTYYHWEKKKSYFFGLVNRQFFTDLLVF